MIKAIFFDLDGTLLPIKDSEFYSLYIKLLVKKLVNYGYDANELIKQTQTLMKLQYENNGSKTNEEVYIDYFYSIYGEKLLSDMPIIDNFYKEEFKELKTICRENKLAKEIVKYAKDKVGIVVLTTNPILPFEALKTRMSFIDLSENDFDFITKYEESHYTKPNPSYFKEVLDKLNLKGEEVILFGNNKLEDGECARACNIKVYLLKDYLIDYDTDYEYEVIDFKDIPSIIDKEVN